MGRAKGWMEEKTGRSAMRSPGRPAINQRLTKQAFWVKLTPFHGHLIVQYEGVQNASN